MFAPMTPTTERIRIQNENAELNRYAVATQPSNLGQCSSWRFMPRKRRPGAALVPNSRQWLPGAPAQATAPRFSNNDITRLRQQDQKPTRDAKFPPVGFLCPGDR